MGTYRTNILFEASNFGDKKTCKKDRFLSSKTAKARHVQKLLKYLKRSRVGK